MRGPVLAQISTGLRKTGDFSCDGRSAAGLMMILSALVSILAFRFRKPRLAGT
jgi:hypothetical protein